MNVIDLWAIARVRCVVLRAIAQSLEEIAPQALQNPGGKATRPGVEPVAETSTTCARMAQSAASVERKTDHSTSDLSSSQVTTSPRSFVARSISGHFSGGTRRSVLNHGQT